MPSEVMLHDAAVFPRRGGHNPGEAGAPARFRAGAPLASFDRFHDPSERFRFPFRSRHYKWIATRGTAVRRRIDTPGVSPASLAQGREVPAYLGRHGRI